MSDILRTILLIHMQCTQMLSCNNLAHIKLFLHRGTITFVLKHASLQLQVFTAVNFLAAIFDSTLVLALPITAVVIARALGAINRNELWHTGNASRSCIEAASSVTLAVGKLPARNSKGARPLQRWQGHTMRASLNFTRLFIQFAEVAAECVQPPRVLLAAVEVGG